MAVLWLTTIPLTAMAIAIFINSMIIGYSVRVFPLIDPNLA
jgi:hypothetical protein